MSFAISLCLCFTIFLYLSTLLNGLHESYKRMEMVEMVATSLDDACQYFVAESSQQAKKDLYDLR